MSRRRNLLAIAAIAALAATPALATSSQPWQPNPFEHRLSNDPAHEFGEPSLAINPVNPKNMIMIYLRNNDGMVPTAAQGKPFVPDERDATQQIQGCDYAVTFDGGKTWKRQQLPANNVGTDPVQNNCSDSIVVFDQHGVAHVMAAAYANFAFAGDDEYRFMSSRDGGRTWSKPSVVAPTMVGEGSHPADYNGIRTYDDRPWLTVDPQTSALYIDGTQVRADGQGTNSVYLTASTDGGTTWTDPIVVPTTTLGSAPLGAAYGILGLTVEPPSGEAGCACLDFLTSTDGGKTLQRIHTKVPDGAGPQTVADPTHRGHFVVMTNPGDGYLYLYRTDDAGHTFSAATRVGVQGLSVVKPWIGFAPNGTLGVGWRGTKGDGSYAFFVASSSDGGRTFVHQLQLSKQFSPAAPPYYVAGDDTSTVALSNDRLLAAWGDWRGQGLEHITWGGYSLP